ncbi:HD family hydrolase [Actinopolymorpha sp. B17G11]|uniref:HD domain-containing protein n=1 Tax=Actinopolymorpha sp. B17G11 TaxID=3160861 RepID=UPI0032E4F032
MTNPDCALAVFVYEVGYLKSVPRTGWAVGGVQGRLESVAEHSFRTGHLAHVIALAEGGNADRAAVLGLYHDVPETRTGDIPHLGRRYLTAAEAEGIIKDQTVDLPEIVAGPIRDAVVEFEAQQTAEARYAREADKLECLAQARQYQIGGAQDIDTWIESSVKALQGASPTAQLLAEQLQATPPGTWWRNAQNGV